MIEYYTTTTSVSLELVVLSGGLRVTGHTPTLTVRDSTTNQYFDFASRSFTGTTVSSTALLTSSIDGLYRYSWDTSGIFNRNTFLTVEFNDATALAIESLLFRAIPLVTGDVQPNLTVGGGGASNNIIVKGGFTKKDRQNLESVLDNTEDVRARVKDDVMPMLRALFNKKTIEKKDIEFLQELKEGHKLMYGEILRILELKDNLTTKKIAEKLRLFIQKEEKEKTALLDHLENVLREEPVIKIEKEEDGDDE